MGSILFSYNQTAYENAVSMMQKCGRAAVIHPTGTGKSFIGFQLAADHPDKKICWCAPSEYIYRTQIENWIHAGGNAVHNIRFLTYSKLIVLDDAELEDLKPDFIVLDEFHRAGAAVWSIGVEQLLRHYPEAQVLGLSATNIRYLDSRRDMAEELFQNHIASVMTLGEAIVRGILNPPRYILSVYQYRNEFTKLKAQVSSAKNKAARDKANEYLEDLKRALENAEGLDKIFEKYMNPSGKYLAFCSGAEHMEDMIRKIPEWFKKIDNEPHVYKVYSEDSGSDEAFHAFKEDCSHHLKLLFCINMLNEGVHVEDVDGVILLRPTISPIIYKQQIGRALTAGKKHTPTIFDVVLNIENVSSVGTIQDEMREAVNHYHLTGEYARSTVNETFEIIDETMDCKRLFEAFEESLSASWDLMYQEAKAYYQRTGNLRIPVKYKTETGLSLGSWLNTQRKVYSGKSPGILTDRQIELLDAIGIIWDVLDDQWEMNFAEAKRYFETHGNLLVPGTFVAASGIKLGNWIAHQRMAKKGRGGRKLTDDQEKKLMKIGMVWDADEERFRIGLEETKKYYQKHGNIDVPAAYKTSEGYTLGTWINLKRRQYKKGTLTQSQICELENLGMKWRVRNGRPHNLKQG